MTVLDWQAWAVNKLFNTPPAQLTECRPVASAVVEAGDTVSFLRPLAPQYQIREDLQHAHVFVTSTGLRPEGISPICPSVRYRQSPGHEVRAGDLGFCHGQSIFVSGGEQPAAPQVRDALVIVNCWLGPHKEHTRPVVALKVNPSGDECNRVFGLAARCWPIHSDLIFI